MDEDFLCDCFYAAPAGYVFFTLIHKDKSPGYIMSPLRAKRMPAHSIVLLEDKIPARSDRILKKIEIP